MKSAKGKTKTATTVLVNFIQDRSGSMQDVWAETVNGFKQFVTELKANAAKDGIKYLFSFTTFDTMVEHPIHEAEVSSVDVDEIKKHAPRGMTALYDAVGMALEKVKTVADKYIGVIVTDGHENSSREWDKDKLNAAIESRLKQGNWTFTYLGTQPETWGDAGAIGIGAGATAAYTPTMASAAYSATADALHAMSRSSAMGSRSLFASHGNSRRIAAAGMTLNPSSPKKSAPVPPKPKSASARRWR